MKRKMLIMMIKKAQKKVAQLKRVNEFHHREGNTKRTATVLTSCRILLKCTSCFLKHTTSCSMEFRSDLSTRRSSDDELSSCDCRFSCWRCLRCSLSDVFEGVCRLCMLSSERGLSDPF